MFPDKATERKILSLAIKCPSEGCDWIGELRGKKVTSCQLMSGIVKLNHSCFSGDCLDHQYTLGTFKICHHDGNENVKKATARLSKQQLYDVQHALKFAFLYRHPKTRTWNSLIWCFIHNLNIPWPISLTLLNFDSLEFNTRRVCPHLARWASSVNRADDNQLY